MSLLHEVDFDVIGQISADTETLCAMQGSSASATAASSAAAHSVPVPPSPAQGLGKVRPKPSASFANHLLCVDVQSDVIFACDTACQLRLGTRPNIIAVGCMPA